MSLVNDYLDNSFENARFKIDHNEISSHQSPCGFIGRIWDRLRGVTKLSNIFHQVSVDLAGDGVGDFTAAENCIKLKEKVANETCKISWATRWFGGHGDVAKSAAEVAKAAETQLFNYWTEGNIAVDAISDDQRRAVLDIYSVLQKTNISTDECNGLYNAVLSLLNISQHDDARYEKLANFFKTKCGDAAIMHYHAGRALEARGKQLDRTRTRNQAAGFYKAARELYEIAAHEQCAVALERIENYYREGGVGQKRNLQAAHARAIALADTIPSYKKVVAMDLLLGRGTERNYQQAFEYAEMNPQETWSQTIQTIAKHLQNLDPTDEQMIELDDAVATLIGSTDIKQFYLDLAQRRGCRIAQGHFVRLAEIAGDENADFQVQGAYKAGFKPVMAFMERSLRTGKALISKDPVAAHRLAVRLADEKNIALYKFIVARDRLIGFGTQVSVDAAIREAESLAVNCPIAANELRAKCTNLYKAGDILRLPAHQITTHKLEELVFHLKKISNDDQDYADMIDMMSANLLPAAMYLKAKASLNVDEQSYLYLSAASAGLPAAEYEVSIALRSSGSEDMCMARKFALEASYHGDMNAKLLVAQDYMMAGDMAKAAGILAELVISKDVSPEVHEAAGVELAKYFKNIYVDKDYTDIVAIMQEAGCSQEDVGLFTIGYMYQTGRIFEEDFPRAMIYFKQVNLFSLMLDKGSDALTKGEVEVAKRWFNKTVEMGDSRGYYHYARLLEHEGDLVNALDCYIDATNRGVAEAWYPAIYMLSEGIGCEKNLQAAIAMVQDPARPQDDARINYLQAQLELKKWLPNWKLVLSALTSAAGQEHFGAKTLLVSLVNRGKIKALQVPNLAGYEESLNLSDPKVTLALMAITVSKGGFTPSQLLEQLEDIREIAGYAEKQGKPLVSDEVRELAYITGEDDAMVEADITELDDEDVKVLRDLGTLTSLPAYLSVAEQADALIHSIVYQDSMFTEDHIVALNIAMNRATPLGQFQAWLEKTMQEVLPMAVKQCLAGFAWNTQRGNELLKTLTEDQRAFMDPWMDFLATNEEQGTMGILTAWLETTEEAIHRAVESYWLAKKST